MKNLTFGGNFLVKLRARIKSQQHGLALKPTEEILKKMKFKKIVQECEKDE